MATARAPSHNPLRVAIIGGGIAGAALAAGLSVAHTRGDIRVRLYEQTASPQELGFAVAFARSARYALSLLDPRVASTIGLPDENDPKAALGSMIFVDGYDSGGDPRVLGENSSPLGQWASRRTAVLEGLLSLVPKDVPCPNKKLVWLEEAKDGQPNKLGFANGETAEADVGKSYRKSSLSTKSYRGLMVIQSSVAMVCIRECALMSSHRTALLSSTRRDSPTPSCTAP
jgi:hypothetical protein